MRQMLLSRLIMFAFLCLWFTNNQAQLIFTKAGGAPGNGDYFPATEAGLYRPVAVAIDANGNLYIADSWANTIRRVDPKSGIISTFAGRGMPTNFSGDGGPAIQAVFGLPTGVAVDGEGNVYIADEENFRIRKVSITTGIISTIAGNGIEGFSGDGGPALQASLGHCRALAVDRLGNLYVVDNTNNRVRKVNATDGTIFTVAGNGVRDYSGDGGTATAASCGGLSGVAVDSAGNVYLADGSHRIRKVDARTGIITTVAGNGFSDHAGDGGPATAASFGLSGPLSGNSEVALDKDGNIYIQDAYNYRVRKVDAKTGVITTIAGNGSVGYSGEGGLAISAGLGSPGGIATDGQGNIYITDANTCQIRRVGSATGIIRTFAGNGKPYYLGDGKKGADVSLLATSLHTDKEGNVFFAGGDLVRKIDAKTGVVTTVAGTDRQAGIDNDSINALHSFLNLPTDISVDEKGNLFIINQRQVRKVDAVTGMITAVAGKIGFEPYPTLPQDGALAATVIFNELSNLALDSSGNIYVSDENCRCIRRVDAKTNQLKTIAGSKFGYAGTSGDGGPATEALLYLPGSLSFDRKGNLYIVDSYVNRIRKVDAVTGIITTVVGTGEKGYAGDGGPALQARLNNPIGITFDKEDNLYIADYGNNVIRKVNASTSVITAIAGNGTSGFKGDGGPAVAASFHSPFDVAVDEDGRIYIADYDNYRIRYICPATALATGQTVGSTVVDTAHDSQAVFQENCTLQASLTASGASPVVGRVADSVWIEPTVPMVDGQAYVQRHFGITPQFNASTATATLTLYFTQEEFTTYNAAPNHGPDLPIDAADAAGNKVHVLIKKRSGTSRDGTGHFETYSGAATDIIPTSVVWDTTERAWAVTFEVHGFSGFFLRSATFTTSTLPFTLKRFTARLQNSDGLIEWSTANEQQVAFYVLERSTDGSNFSAATKVSAKSQATNNYQYVDKNITSLASGILYYRLKTVEGSGNEKYSDNVQLNLPAIQPIVALYPNPITTVANLLITSLHNESLHCQVVDANGRVVVSKNIEVVKGSNTIPFPLTQLTSGIYTISMLGTDGVYQLKFVKQ